MNCSISFMTTVLLTKLENDKNYRHLLKKEISKLKKEIEDVQKKKSLDFKKLPAKLKKKIFEEVVEEVQVIPGSIYKGGEVIKVIFRDTRIKVPKRSKKK